MTRWRWAGAAAIAAALLAAAPVEARDEAGLRACLRANLFERSVAQDITIAQSDAAGMIRRLAGRWYWQRDGADQRGMLKLAAPADLAGAAYLLTTKDGQEAFFLYLPSVRKVRKVVGATMAQSLFGSGLSAFDLKFLFSGLVGGQLTRIGPEKVGNRRAERWRYLPPSDPNILYDRVELVIDEVWCLPLSADLYGGVPWKTLTVDTASVQKSGNRWRAGRLLLKDLREGNQAEIRLGTEQVDTALPAALFDPGQFYRAK